MNTFVRITLVATVMATVTAVPASAATSQSAVTHGSAGICHRWPKLCSLNPAELVLDHPAR